MLSALLPALTFPVGLAAGLLAPGWLLGRALRTPAGFAGSLLGSAVILTNLVITLDALGIALTAAQAGLALAVVCAGLAAFALSGQKPSIPPASAASDPWASRWLLAPAAVGFIAIGIRVVLNPLSGFDAPFRWDFLAREMLRTGGLGFYPAVTANDFVHYGWCDGIAPLVSSLYFWSYACLGHAATWAATPVVLGQVAALFVVVWQLADVRGGPNAAAAATALVASSGALLWGVSMGQETGLTALALIAMFLFLEKCRTAPAARWLVWAGVAAGAGALAREYGLAFIGLGGFALAWQRPPRRGWLEFAGAAAVVAGPWYLRNWLKTGNPLYPHPVGGLFPTNPIHVDYLRAVSESMRSSGLDDAASLAGWPAALALLALSGALVVLGLAAAVRHWRESPVGLLSLGGMVAVWYWSIGMTSGGHVYSLRVLCPALALGAALGGPALVRIAAHRHGWLATAAIFVLAIDASGRAFFLPVDATVAWWRTPLSTWRQFDQAAAAWRAHPNWAKIAEAAEGRLILVSDPLCHATLVEHGARPVPYFSPDVRFLFGTPPDFPTCVAQLRSLGFRFVLQTRLNPVIDRQTADEPFFRALRATAPVATTKLYVVYDLYSPDHVQKQ